MPLPGAVGSIRELTAGVHPPEFAGGRDAPPYPSVRDAVPKGGSMPWRGKIAREDLRDGSVPPRDLAHLEDHPRVPGGMVDDPGSRRHPALRARLDARGQRPHTAQEGRLRVAPLQGEVIPPRVRPIHRELLQEVAADRRHDHGVEGAGRMPAPAGGSTWLG